MSVSSNFEVVGDKRLVGLKKLALCWIQFQEVHQALPLPGHIRLACAITHSQTCRRAPHLVVLPSWALLPQLAYPILHRHNLSWIAEAQCGQHLICWTANPPRC